MNKRININKRKKDDKIRKREQIFRFFKVRKLQICYLFTSKENLKGM